MNPKAIKNMFMKTVFINRHLKQTEESIFEKDMIKQTYADYFLIKLNHYLS